MPHAAHTDVPASPLSVRKLPGPHIDSIVKNTTAFKNSMSMAYQLGKCFAPSPSVMKLMSVHKTKSQTQSKLMNCVVQRIHPSLYQEIRGHRSACSTLPPAVREFSTSVEGSQHA